MIAKERVYLDKTRKRVLKHAHPDCATLLAGIGDEIPEKYESQCKGGRAPGKDIPNAPRDLPAITQSKIEAQAKAAAKHTNTQPMKTNKDEGETEQEKKKREDDEELERMEKEEQEKKEREELENKEKKDGENKGSGLKINAKKDKE